MKLLKELVKLTWKGICMMCCCRCMVEDQNTVYLCMHAGNLR